MRHLVMATITLAAGCATAPRQAEPAISIVSWPSGNEPSVRLERGDLQLYSTLRDAERNPELLRLLEAATTLFERRFGPLTTKTPRSVFVFANRDQWARFTSALVPEAEAQLYFRIERGGYTRGDVVVLFDVGDVGTRSLVVHEAFHQFCARSMKTRLPASLEEGLAVSLSAFRETPRGEFTFDDKFVGGYPTRLKSAAQAGRLLPLRQLLEIDAATAVMQRPSVTGEIYAQWWAIAQWMLRDHGDALTLWSRGAAAGVLRDVPPLDVLASLLQVSPTQAASEYESFVGKLIDDVD